MNNTEIILENEKIYTYSMYFINENKIKDFQSTYQWDKIVFLDEYFDNEDHILCKNNIWLRRRDIFNWSLKIIKENNEKTIIEQIEDIDLIVRKLIEIGCYDQSNNKHTSLNPLNYCPTLIVSIPTSRWIMIHNNEVDDLNFYVDSYYIDENKFYNIATLSTKKKDGSKFLKELMNYGMFQYSTKNKVIQVLSENNRNLYQKIKKYINDRYNTDYIENLVEKCLFVPDQIRPKQMKEFSNIAIKYNIDLKGAIHFVNTLSHDSSNFPN